MKLPQKYAGVLLAVTLVVGATGAAHAESSAHVAAAGAKALAKDRAAVEEGWNGVTITTWSPGATPTKARASTKTAKKAAQKGPAGTRTKSIRRAAKKLRSTRAALSLARQDLGVAKAAAATAAQEFTAASADRDRLLAEFGQMGRLYFAAREAARVAAAAEPGLKRAETEARATRDGFARAANVARDEIDASTVQGAATSARLSKEIAGVAQAAGRYRAAQTRATETSAAATKAVGALGAAVKAKTAAGAKVKGAKADAAKATAKRQLGAADAKLATARNAHATALVRAERAANTLAAAQATLTNAQAKQTATQQQVADAQARGTRGRNALAVATGALNEANARHAPLKAARDRNAADLATAYGAMRPIEANHGPLIVSTDAAQQRVSAATRTHRSQQAAVAAGVAQVKKAKKAVRMAKKKFRKARQR